MAERLRKAVRYASYSDAEEALSEAFIDLILRHRKLLTERPFETWMGLLYKVAKNHLVDLMLFRIDSIDALRAAAGEEAFVGARPCVPVDTEVVNPGAKKSRHGNSEVSVIEALQAFRDLNGRPPLLKECKSDPKLPSAYVMRRLFGSYSKAITAAGMIPAGGRRTRRNLSEREAAEICAAFRRRNMRWPNWADVKRYERRQGDEVPTQRMMLRYFGGTTEEAVRVACERILSEGDDA